MQLAQIISLLMSVFPLVSSRMMLLVVVEMLGNVIVELMSRALVMHIRWKVLLTVRLHIYNRSMTEMIWQLIR